MCRYAVDMFFVGSFLPAPALRESENNLFTLICQGDGRPSVFFAGQECC